MTLESMLSYGVQRLPDQDLRLQLVVFNAAMVVSIALSLGFSLILLISGHYDLLIYKALPFLLLFGLIPLIARRRYFFLARILFVALCQASVAFGVYSYGPSSPFAIFYLDLALFPFLIFRAKERRWIVLTILSAFVLFVLLELQLFPTQDQPLPQDIQPYARLLFSTGAFIGVIAPSALVFWQTHVGFRRALRKHRVQARDEKFVAIGRLAAGAAHEINNPLAIVQLTLENLENTFGVLKEPAAQVRMRHGYAAIQRIHEILQKLLSSSLIPMAQPESWPARDIAGLIEQRCRRILEDQGVHLILRTTVPPGYRVLCHRHSVLDVVESLIHNALDALAGQVRPRIELTLCCDRACIQIKVEDSGPGVSEEKLRSIFTPFFTTKDVGSGLGLSLYSARCIAQQYGGDLTCESGPGGRFLLTLPLDVETSKANLGS
ncbi:sensor histidine kinase [Oligoflexus tunisiensis]|uniref:sensor histidine kinase n=1 Tax=Oligoflexus tunisiensis TaxID=708132 RepID=UPI00114D1A61|nr:HAMP domain-containing sensor histidine kinase [Oligoflexus tunisiensis]